MLNLYSDLARAADPLATLRNYLVSIGCAPNPDPWQHEVLTCNHPRILLNIHRQAGKSATTACLATNSALDDPGLIIIGSPSQRQSGLLLRTIIDVMRVVDGGTPKVTTQSATTLELENGAHIVSLPGNEDTIRGYSAPKLILLDEAARIEDEYYAAIRPMLLTGQGRLIQLSTPKGRRGKFFEAWEFGGDSYMRVRVPVTECPRAEPEFLEQEQRELGPLQYASEYLCKFVDDAESYFPSHLIEAALSDEVLPLLL